MTFAYVSKLVFKHVMLVVIFSTIVVHHLVCPAQSKDTITYGHGNNNNNGLATDGPGINQEIRLTKEKLEKSSIFQRSGREQPPITTLVLLQVLHRHGDRSPTHTYPNNPHKDAWPQGLGQLSTIGMNQSYELGKFLLNNYSSFLGSNLRPSQIYIRSTDYDRTLMTAECVAAGLFSSREEIKAVPVPIHSVPLKTDKLLRPTYACEYIKDLRAAGAAVHDSKRQTIFDKKHMLHLSRETGMKMNVTSLLDLADVVFCEKIHELQPPDWLTKEMQADLIAYSLEKEFVSPNEAKYLMGTLFDTLMNNMKNKIMNPFDPVNLNLYSAHESTVRFLKALLGVDNQKEVPYIGAIIIELHYLHDEHYIRFLYRNSSDQSSQTLRVHHCNNLEFCRFIDFQKAYEELMFSDEDWNKVCLEDSSSKKISIKENLVPILVAVLVACLALVMFLGYRLYSLSHQERHKLNMDQYTLLETDADADAADSDKEIAMEDLSCLLANHESSEQQKESGSA